MRQYDNCMLKTELLGRGDPVASQSRSEIAFLEKVAVR